MHFYLKITLCLSLNLIVSQHKMQYYITLINFELNIIKDLKL